MKYFLYRLATDQIRGPIATFIKAILLLLSYLYEFGIDAILWAYDKKIFKKRKLERPVISVGNITIGGAGKTPLTALIMDFYCQKRYKPVVLTRGYMAESGSPREQGEPVQNDEVQLLKNLFPHERILVGADRYSLGKTALKEGPATVFVLDDGFQHWKLARDIDIVAIDAMNPLGNTNLIPRGILREPPSSLKRADIFVVTRSDQAVDRLGAVHAKLVSINPLALIVEAIHRPVIFRDLLRNDCDEQLGYISGRSVCCFSGIGNPDSFAATLTSLGADIRKDFRFIDHHPYHQRDIQRIVDYCLSNGIQTAVTTQKDAIKLTEFSGLFGLKLRLLSLEVMMELTRGRDDFYQRLSDLLPR